MFNYYAEVAAFPDADAVAAMEADNRCMVNIDGKCIPTVPLAARLGAAADACPQKSALVCAGNQPYSGTSGWGCAAAAAGLAQRGV